MECGTKDAAPAKQKQMAKRTKSAVAASSQPKKGAAKKAGAAASKPARAAEKAASESGGDVMTAVIDKRKHHGKWRWKVQWKSGAMVSSDNKREG
jgi:hypothetical protein